MKKIKFSINGEEKECDILYTFKSDNTNKNYLLCSEDGIKVFSFIYYPNDREKGIAKITNQEDWDEVEKFINLVGEEQ